MTFPCECGARPGFFLHKKNGKIAWVPLKKENRAHGLCPKCYRALASSILTRSLRGRKEPEISEIP